MSKQLFEQSIDPIYTVQDLIDQLTALTDGCDRSTMYLSLNGDSCATLLGLRIIEETLSDGSKVFDLSIDDQGEVFDDRRDLAA